MKLALAWVAVLVGPSVAAGLLLFVWRLLRRQCVGWHWLTRPVPRPAGPPIERIAADLRRLRRELMTLEVGSRPGKALQLRAVTLAYDDALCAACSALEVPGAAELAAAPAGAHAAVVQTLEARLAAAGLDVVHPAGRRD